MESRVGKALELHQGSCNCAQAVLCAYADLVGLETDEAYRLGAGLGSGMGGMEGTCGALVGACILSGLKNSAGPEVRGGNAAAAKCSRAMVSQFGEIAGATRCADIKGAVTGTPLYSCRDCVALGARLAEQVVFAD